VLDNSSACATRKPRKSNPNYLVVHAATGLNPSSFDIRRSRPG
jgi:hypothetical protein